jgi:hypothetical protein
LVLVLGLELWQVPHYSSGFGDGGRGDRNVLGIPPEGDHLCTVVRVQNPKMGHHSDRMIVMLLR